MIIGKKVGFIKEVGKRENLEDSVWPYQASEPEKYNLFIVCDGVGGSSKGEIASQVTCDKISEYFINNIRGVPNEGDIQRAVEYAEIALDQYTAKHKDSKGMATTLTLLYFNNDTATVAHIGDSRVYHVRNGDILFKTHDHSYVNELVASGYIKPEEAINHPKKNMITRAISGSAEPALADVAPITDIRQGDYFILCTDGILEGIDEDFIKKSFVINAELGDIISNIEQLCFKKSSDNFSGIFIKIDNNAAVKTDDVKSEPAPQPTKQAPGYPPQKMQDDVNTGGGSKTRNIILAIIIVILAVTAFKLYSVLKHKNDNTGFGNTNNTNNNTKNPKNRDTNTVATDADKPPVPPNNPKKPKILNNPKSNEQSTPAGSDTTQ